MALNHNNNNPLPVIPPPPQPISPPLTVNHQFPAPDGSTETLREYVALLMAEEQLKALAAENHRGLVEVYEEREAMERRLLRFPTLTVTNYSEYLVLFKALNVPNDIKVWVHQNTSPRSVECIRRRRAKDGCRRRILFAADLTPEQLAGNLDTLFDVMNPKYSSDSSDIVEEEVDEDDDHGYSDPELVAVAAEAARINDK